MRVSVNISGLQVVDEHLCEQVEVILEKTGMDPEWLTLEVTESSAMRDQATAERNLHGLHDLGIRLALDDFGTGYSSLSFLRQLPVEVVKIDQSFVAGLGVRAEDEMIVAGVISMAHALGHVVIAEGIETVAQRDELQRLGCRWGQGFLWSRAVPLAELAGDDRGDRARHTTRRRCRRRGNFARSKGEAVTDEILPFRIDVPEEDLVDLRERLTRTRWPEAETVDDWSQGIPLAYVQELCEYWATKYDWRATEARLNAFPQFRTELDGLGIHFLHVRSPEPDALPLVITHGWPGSVVEFHKVIGPLTDPVAHGGDAADAFHVVCPSLPGYGFSDQPSSAGLEDAADRRGVGDADGAPRLRPLRRAGRRLGRERHHVASASRTRSTSSASTSTWSIALPDPSMGEMTEQEQAALESLTHYQRQESGYSTQQSTRPQTLGYGLVDSPAGQAAWIVEKFWAWTDCDGHPENVLTPRRAARQRDALLAARHRRVVGPALLGELQRLHHEAGQDRRADRRAR